MSIYFSLGRPNAVPAAAVYDRSGARQEILAATAAGANTAQNDIEQAKLQAELDAALARKVQGQTQAQIAETLAEEPEAKSNTLLYVGLGAVALFLVGGLALVSSKSKVAGYRRRKKRSKRRSRR